MRRSPAAGRARRATRDASRVGAALPLLLVVGCGGAMPDDFGWFGDADRPRSGRAPVELRWVHALVPSEEGEFVPVERASAALDPAHGRVYVGSTAGSLIALSPRGAVLYRVETDGAVEARPALEAAADELLVTTEQGTVHSFHASTGAERWRRAAGGPLRTPALLARDAAYVFTERDTVVALGRATGEVLWTYARELPGGFAVSGHAELALAGSKLLAAFTDGVLVALDASDGRVLWERDTSQDLPAATSDAARFLDLDATPVVVDETIYVAAFGAGLYALELSSGTVRWREPGLTGVTSLAVTSRGLVVGSADHGVLLVDPATRAVVWQRALERGAPGPLAQIGPMVVFGESRGSLLWLSLATGEEVGRFDAGHGFSAPVAYAEGLAFVLSNGGSLYALRVGG